MFIKNLSLLYIVKYAIYLFIYVLHNKFDFKDNILGVLYTI